MNGSSGSVLVIGTRGSALALAQSNFIRERLQAAHPGLTCELRTISTEGDRRLDTPLPAIGGKGVFTAEIEHALHSGSIDLAVHSLKDLPTAEVDGLVVGAIPEREDARDALISASGQPLSELPAGARVGTSSLRRSAQLLAAHKQLQLSSIRGNVDTRLRKLDAGEYDAIVLAAAGLHRLRLSGRISELLGYDTMLPAPGQGALAVQCRSNDQRVRGLIAVLDDAATRRAVQAERSLLEELGGGCSAPIGAYAVQSGDQLDLQGFVGTADGSRSIRMRMADADDAQIGRRLARQMLENGARELLS